MRQTLALFTLFVAVSAGAQQFRLGPRYSNYSTDVSVTRDAFDTSRQSAFGVVGDYRNGAFVLDFLADHDPENGISISDILPFVERYERTRGEVTVGYSLSLFDLQAGARFDSISIGSDAIPRGDFFGTSDVTHQAIVAGIRVHTPASQKVGFYALGRGYVGSFDFDGSNSNSDSTGWRAEAGLTFPIGESAWSVEPGFEYEDLRSQNDRLELKTNRFFVNFIYAFGK